MTEMRPAASDAPEPSTGPGRGDEAEGDRRRADERVTAGKIVRRYVRATELGEDPGDLTTLAD